MVKGLVGDSGDSYKLVEDDDWVTIGIRGIASLVVPVIYCLFKTSLVGRLEPVHAGMIPVSRREKRE